MKKEIFINATSQEMRVAITEDKRLAELFLELPDHERHVGSIHIGRVERVVQGMNAAFVDIGLEQHAFLHFSDAENAGEDYSDLLTEDDDDEASSSRSSKTSSRAKSGGRSAKKSSKKSAKSTKKSSRKKSTAKSDEDDEEKKSSKSSSKKSSKKSSTKKSSSKKSSSKKSTKKSSKKSDEAEESKSGGEEKSETSEKSSSKRSRSRRGRGSSKKSTSGTDKEQTETSEKKGEEQKKDDGSEKGPKKSSRGRSRGRGSRSKKSGGERPSDEKKEGASEKKEESGKANEKKAEGKPDSSEGNEEKKSSSSRRRSSRRRGGSKKSQEGSEKQASGESSKEDRKDDGTSSEKESRSDRDGNKKTDGSAKKESSGEDESKKSGSSSRSRSRRRGGSRSRGSSSSNDGQSTDTSGEKGSDRKDSRAKESDKSKGSDGSKGSDNSGSSKSSKSSSKRSSRSRGSSKKSSGGGDSSNKNESSSSNNEKKSSDSSDKGEDSKKSTSRSRSRSRSRSSSKKSDDGGSKRMDAKLPTFQTRRHGEIQIDLKRGQEILVQVIRESYASKGVKVSTKVSLPGRFLVLMPVDPTIGISRKVVDVKERRRLRSIAKKILPDGFGCIIRTVAEKKETKMLEEELKMLLERWREIEAKLKKAKGPMKLYSDVSVASGVMRDMFTRDVGRVVIDSKPLHQEIKDYVSWAAPALQNKIELYDGKEPIFAKFGLERDLDRMMATKVYLNNGGYIILEQTEAMMVIDVNSGRYAKSKEQELNALEINLESAREIARQIRLRDIGGLIVIDFIDLYEEKNRRKVHEEMKRAMSNDRAKFVVLPMTQFGLVQMTRQRIRQQLVETMSEECPTCRGTGTVQSKGTTLRAIENWLVNFRAESREFRLTLTANPQIVEFLSDGDGMSRLTKMMLKHFVRIKLVPDESLDMESFRFHSTRRQEDVTEKYLGAPTSPAEQK